MAKGEPDVDSAHGPVGDSTDSPVIESQTPTTSSESQSDAADESGAVADVESDSTAETATQDPVVDAVVNEAPAPESDEVENTASTTGDDAPTAPADEMPADEMPVGDEPADSEPAGDDGVSEVPDIVQTGVDQPDESPAGSGTATDAAGESPAEHTDQAVPVVATTNDDASVEDTAGEQPGGAPAPAPNDDATAQFAAVPPTSASTTEDEPARSPADENTTEVITTEAAPAGVDDSPTERISTAKAAPVSTAKADSAPAAAHVPDWKAEPAAPQYIPPAGGSAQNRPAAAPKKSRKGLWFALAALVVIAAVIVAVVAVVSSGSEDSDVPADVAAERALEYTTALRDGDIVTLRQITCGEAQQRFTTMSDEEFADDHRIQKDNNELVGVDGVKASKIVNDGNGAVVEVVAYKTLTPNEKLDVALTLSKIDGEWKVCKG